MQDLHSQRGWKLPAQKQAATRGEIVRDALRRELHLLRFERLRRQALPYLGTPEKVRSTAAQLVSVIESR